MHSKARVGLLLSILVLQGCTGAPTTEVGDHPLPDETGKANLPTDPWNGAPLVAVVQMVTYGSLGSFRSSPPLLPAKFQADDDAQHDNLTGNFSGPKDTTHLVVLSSGTTEGAAIENAGTDGFSIDYLQDARGEKGEHLVLTAFPSGVHALIFPAADNRSRTIEGGNRNGGSRPWSTTLQPKEGFSVAYPDESLRIEVMLLGISPRENITVNSP